MEKFSHFKMIKVTFHCSFNPRIQKIILLYLSQNTTTEFIFTRILFELFPGKKIILIILSWYYKYNSINIQQHLSFFRLIGQKRGFFSMIGLSLNVSPFNPSDFFFF